VAGGAEDGRARVAHKSDVGGVVLGVDGPDRLAAAYADLAARLGPRALVAAMPARGWSWPSGWSSTGSSGPW
jgi:acetate---CoA ligase (ADP-forming)